MMLPRFKLPAILALTGLTFSLLQAVFYPEISKAARAMFQDQQLGLRFSNLILSAGSAIQITFLILAVFLGRRSQLRQVDAPREHVDFALSQIAAGQSYDQIESRLRAARSFTTGQWTRAESSRSGGSQSSSSSWVAQSYTGGSALFAWNFHHRRHVPDCSKFTWRWKVHGYVRLVVAGRDPRHSRTIPTHKIISSDQLRSKIFFSA